MFLEERTSPVSADIENLKAAHAEKLRKLRRRQNRLVRKAWADGFLTGGGGGLRPGDLALDLGANVGDVSARLLDSGADVIAFDPEPWAVAKLRARFADEPRFTLHNAAVGVRAGNVTLRRAHDFEEDQSAGSVKSTLVEGGRAISEQNSINVLMIDFVGFMRDLVAQRGPVQFLKMDIEGAELELLDALDAADLIKDIRCMVVETHEKKFRHLRAQFAELRGRLTAKYNPAHVNLDWI